MSGAPSEHLLRTLAPLPPSWRILEVIGGEGRHTEALARLGFDFYTLDVDEEAIRNIRERIWHLVPPDELEQRVRQSGLLRFPFEDEQFDWVLVYHVGDRFLTLRDFRYMMGEVFRVMKWGAWVSVGVPEQGAGVSGLAFTPELLDAEMAAAGFVLAERPHREKEGERPILGAIYRKVNEETPL